MKAEGISAKVEVCARAAGVSEQDIEQMLRVIYLEDGGSRRER
jgi:hypothetical protein